MKRIVAFLLSMAMLFVVCGCGSSTQAADTTKYAYELAFPTYYMYYLIDTESCTAESIYYSGNTVLLYSSGSYKGDLATGASVLFTDEDGSSWTEKIKFGKNTKSLYVAIGDDPTETLFKQVEVSKVESILEKAGY